MKTFSLILLVMVTASAFGQQTIRGSITDKKGNPVVNANIYFEGSYDGCISDAQGNFALNTDLSGDQIFIASFIGYEKYSHLLHLEGKDSTIKIVLREILSEINEVSITAGVFSASDEKKSATLSSFDIASTASAMGDIYGAYATMPGSQKVGEEGMLFVRGGESYETKTYMDGMLVQSPYFLQHARCSHPGALFAPALLRNPLQHRGLLGRIRSCPLLHCGSDHQRT